MTMTESKLALAYRPMTLADAPDAYRLAQAVQWPHRLEDWQDLLRTGLGVVAHAGDEVVGVAMYWLHGTTHASIGMVITSPERQGQGIGRAMMNEVMRALQGRSVVLNSTAAGKGLYETLGFVARYTVVQHQGAVFDTLALPLAPGERIRPMGVTEGPVLAALCARAVGMARGTTLAALRASPDCVVLERDGAAAGFAMCRRVGRAHLIGPVVAPDIDSAKLLINHWMGTHLYVYLRVDVVDCPMLDAWVSSRGLLPATTFLTMVHGEPAQRDESLRIFTLVNLALA
jgi:GNAT superfamily N-acetyltransferase